MAKLSISKVLETRRKIRLLTVLASFLLVFMLLQGFVLNNPKKSKAIGHDTAGNLVINESAVVDTDGRIYTMPVGQPPVDTGLDIDNENVVVGSGTTTFFGGQRQLKSMKVTGSSMVTHLGPGKSKTKVDAGGPIVAEGWFLASTDVFRVSSCAGDLQLLFPGRTVQPATNNRIFYGCGYVSRYVTGLIPGTWYSFTIFNANGTSFFDTLPPSNYDEGPLLSGNNIKPTQTSSSTNNVLVSYYNAGCANSYTDNCINNLVAIKKQRALEANATFFRRLFVSEAEFDLGLNREINIVMDGDFVIEQNGRIDVLGKGYVGGREGEVGGGSVHSGGSNLLGSGFGPGAGFMDLAASTAGGGGGGYGGRGGTGGDSEFDFARAGLSYGSFTDPNEMGSGGGGANGNEKCRGGSGGGLVIISANNISIGPDAVINASGGGNILLENDIEYAECGGGSGGTINLRSLGSLSMPTKPDVLIARGGDGGWDNTNTPGTLPGGDGGGGRVAVRANKYYGVLYDDLLKSNDSFELENVDYTSKRTTEPIINVLPGRWIYDLVYKNIVNKLVGLAERGTVYVGNSGASNNIKKWLDPIDRNGKSDFNPYAVQDGDVIRVNIEVSNLFKGTEAKIKDEWLRSANKVCQPTVYVIDPDIVDTEFKFSEWIIPANSSELETSSIITRSYLCKITTD